MQPGGGARCRLRARRGTGGAGGGLPASRPAGTSHGQPPGPRPLRHHAVRREPGAAIVPVGAVAVQGPFTGSVADLVMVGCWAGNPLNVQFRGGGTVVSAPVGCGGGVDRGEHERGHASYPVPYPAGEMRAVRDAVAAGARPVRTEARGRPGGWGAGRDRSAGAPVHVRLAVVPGGDLRRAEPGPDQPARPLHPAASQAAGAYRRGPGRPTWRPAGGQARHAGGQGHSATATASHARSGRRIRTGIGHGRIRAAQATHTRHCWWISKPGGRSRCCPAASRAGRPLTHRPPRGGDRLPRPRVGLLGSREAGRTPGDPDRGCLACLAQPRPGRGEDGDQPLLLSPGA